VIPILFWPFEDAPAVPGVDLSWGVALHTAALEHLRWGSDIAFTYGPLGFLAVPTPYLGWTSALALLFCYAVYAAAAATVLWTALRHVPLWVAVLVALGAGRAFILIPPFETLTILAFVWSLEAVLRGPLGRWQAVATAAGLVVAVGLLGKLNVGLFMAAIVGLALTRITRPWWRGPLLFAAATGVVVVVGWLVIGQQAGDLPAFALSSLEFLRGYSDAMALDDLPNSFLAVGLLFIVAVALAIAASYRWRTEPIAGRITAAAIGLIYAIGLWKSATVRVDVHLTVAAAAAMLVVAPLTTAARADRVRLPLVAIAIASLFAYSHLLSIELPGPMESAGALASQAARALVPGNQVAALAQTRQDLAAGYALPDSVLAAVTGHSVHVDGWEAAVVVAYPEIKWDPLPIFQAYAAYTPALDETNAARLRADDGPDRILREDYWFEGERWAVDHRNRWFESPAAVLETFCRYVEVAASERWQVLARTSRQCLPGEPVSVVTARAGEAIAVPTESRADRFLVARITGFAPGPIGRLRSLLWKGDQWFITVDDSRYRLVPATAADGLLLAVPPSVVASPPFAFGAPARSLMVTSDVAGGSDDVLTFEFVSVPWLAETPGSDARLGIATTRGARS
jgi:hypothetical protein